MDVLESSIQVLEDDLSELNKLISVTESTHLKHLLEEQKEIITRQIYNDKKSLEIARTKIEKDKTDPTNKHTQHNEDSEVKYIKMDKYGFDASDKNFVK